MSPQTHGGTHTFILNTLDSCRASLCSGPLNTRSSVTVSRHTLFEKML